MRILDADAQTRIENDRYYIRVAATTRVAALLFALGIRFRYIDPREDGGRAWYEFEYSTEIDEAMIDLVEFSATLREGAPSFGQIALEGFEQ
jgi:hypothetical protein